MKPGRRYTASLGSIVAMVLGLFLCTIAFAEDKTADEPAIPPGQEDLLLAMLGLGASLPGCDLVDGQVNYTVVTATYACPSGEVVYELAHRSKAGRETIPTDQFAITLTTGTPPRGFADALVSLVRSREGEFEWVWPAANDPQ